MRDCRIAGDLTASLNSLRVRYLQFRHLDESATAHTVMLRGLPLELRDADVLRKYIEQELYFGQECAWHLGVTFAC